MANDKKDITDTVNSDMQRDKEIEKRKNADVVPTCSICGGNNGSNNNHEHNMGGNTMPVHGCGCVGYAYVPSQVFNQTYTVQQGLENGTMFPELNLNIDEYGKVCKGVGM